MSPDQLKEPIKATPPAEGAAVVVGEITSAWDRVGPIIADVVAQRALPHALTRIVPAERAAVLRGAVALVVQEHFGAPSVA